MLYFAYFQIQAFYTTFNRKLKSTKANMYVGTASVPASAEQGLIDILIIIRVVLWTSNKPLCSESCHAVQSFELKL